MGRGDKRTKKGKIFKGSFGNSRPANPVKATAVVEVKPKKEAAAKETKKAAPKKAAAKKKAE